MAHQAPDGWAPRLDQAVRWPFETGREIWTVKKINTSTGLATVVQAGDKSAKRRLAPFHQLEPIDGHVRTRPRVEVPDVHDEIAAIRERREAQEAARIGRMRLADVEAEANKRAPVKLRRRVDEYLDHIEFSVGALRYYNARVLKWRRPSLREIEEELRTELHYGDFLPSKRRYGQIQGKRVVVHLPQRPSADDPVFVSRLHVISSKASQAA